MVNKYKVQSIQYNEMSLYAHDTDTKSIIGFIGCVC